MMPRDPWNENESAPPRFLSSGIAYLDSSTDVQSGLNNLPSTNSAQIVLEGSDIDEDDLAVKAYTNITSNERNVSRRPAINVNSDIINDDDDCEMDDWSRVNRELAQRKAREEQIRMENGPNEHRSLYEVLQANKAAKQDAYEESMKLKHQYRSLDADEIDFLAGLDTAERARELALEQDTMAQLQTFRRVQETIDRDTQQQISANRDAEQLALADPDVWRPRKRRIHLASTEIESSTPDVKISQSDQSFSDPSNNPDISANAVWIKRPKDPFINRRLPPNSTLLTNSNNPDSKNDVKRNKPSHDTPIPNPKINPMSITLPNSLVDDPDPRNLKKACLGLGLSGYSSDDSA